MRRRFPHSGRWRPRSPAEAVPLFLARPKSEPHRKGWDTRRAKRSAEIAAHIEALGLDMAMRRGWL